MKGISLFSNTAKPYMELNQPVFLQAPVSIAPGVKRMNHDAENSHSSNTKVRMHRSIGLRKVHVACLPIFIG
jgi:hypothetical protein